MGYWDEYKLQCMRVEFNIDFPSKVILYDIGSFRQRFIENMPREITLVFLNVLDSVLKNNKIDFVSHFHQEGERLTQIYSVRNEHVNLFVKISDEVRKQICSGVIKINDINNYTYLIMNSNIFKDDKGVYCTDSFLGGDYLNEGMYKESANVYPSILEFVLKRRNIPFSTIFTPDEKNIICLYNTSMEYIDRFSTIAKEVKEQRCNIDANVFDDTYGYVQHTNFLDAMDDSDKYTAYGWPHAIYPSEECAGAYNIKIKKDK